jgi:hypothetical protein
MRLDRFEKTLIIFGVLALLLVLGSISPTFRMVEIMTEENLLGSTHLQVIDQTFMENQTYNWNLNENCTGIDCSLDSVKISGSIIVNNSGFARIYIENDQKRYLIFDKTFGLTTTTTLMETTTSTIIPTTTIPETTTTLFVSEENVTTTSTTSTILTTTTEVEEITTSTTISEITSTTSATLEPTTSTIIPTTTILETTTTIPETTSTLIPSTTIPEITTTTIQEPVINQTTTTIETTTTSVTTSSVTTSTTLETTTSTIEEPTTSTIIPTTTIIETTSTLIPTTTETTTTIVTTTEEPTTTQETVTTTIEEKMETVTEETIVEEKLVEEETIVEETTIEEPTVEEETVTETETIITGGFVGILENETLSNVTKVFYFSEECVDTCQLIDKFNKTSYDLIFEMDPNVKIRLDSITYTWKWYETTTTTTTLPMNLTQIVYGDLIQGEVKIGEPVEWIQHIKIENLMDVSLNKTISINVPPDASNISLFLNDLLVSNSSEFNLLLGPKEELLLTLKFFTEPVEMEIVELDLNLTSLLPLEAKNIQIFENDTLIGNYKDSGQIKLKIPKAEKKIFVHHNSSLHYHNISVEILSKEKKLKLIKKLNETDVNITDIINEKDRISWNISRLSETNATLKLEPEKIQGKAEIGKPVNWTMKISNYTVNYETTAPEKIEETTQTGKRITILSNASDHYYNVSVFADLPDLIHKPRLYHIINESRIDVTKDALFDVKYLDINNNNKVDRIEWIVPQLSNQTFEISITILNPYTYLRDKEVWTVAFNTTGTADLTINSTNAGWVEFFDDNNETFDEMKFVYIKCGNNSLNNVLKLKDSLGNVYNYSDLTENDSIKITNLIIENYNCNETGYVKNYMIKAGYATLQFTFGSEVAFAYDPNFGTTCPGSITTANSVYTQTADITNNDSSICISVDANNVTIDCQGHKIDGINAALSVGIQTCGGYTDTTVKNCIITDWEIGIQLYGSTEMDYFNVIENNTIMSCTRGIELWNWANSNTFIDNIIKENDDYGFYLFDRNVPAENNSITGGSIHSNGQYDYWLGHGSSDTYTYFRDTNWTNRSVYLNSMEFAYNNQSSDGPWLYTSMSGGKAIYRLLINWTSDSVEWNETPIGTGNFYMTYNLTGLEANTPFDVYNNGTKLKTEASGNEGEITSFNVYLPTAETQLVRVLRNYSLNSPDFSSISRNNSVAGQPTSFNLKWNDTAGLDGYTFYFDNCTGSFSDEWNSWTGNPTEEWSNETRIISSTVGCTIRWKVTANDTDGIETTSDVYSFETTDIPFPNFVGQNKTLKIIPGDSIKFYSNWTDVDGPHSSIFSWNQSDSWSNDTTQSLGSEITTFSDSSTSKNYEFQGENSLVEGYIEIPMNKEVTTARINVSGSDKKVGTTSDVDTSAGSSPSVGYSIGRHGFYANGYYWAFYGNSTDMAYRTSSDGLTWGSETYVRDINLIGLASGHSIWWNGSHVSYAYAKWSGSPLIFRMGTLSGNTVNWEPERTILSAGSNYRDFPVLVVNDSGYAAIGYSDDDNDASYWYPYAVISDSTDGTSWGSSYKLSTTDSDWGVIPVALDGYFYFIYGADGNTLKARKWNGTYQSEEEISTSNVYSSYAYNSITAVEYNDVIHVVFTKSDGDLVYINRSSDGTWSNEENIAEGGGDPSLQVNSTNGDLNLFYDGYGGAGISMIQRIDGSWGTSHELFSDNDPELGQVSAFYQTWNDQSAVLWVIGGTADDVKFGFDISQSYSSNIKIYTGSQPPEDWNYVPELDPSNSPITVNLNDTKLTEIVDSCNCPGCSVVSDDCKVPINVSTGTAGNITLDDVYVYSLSGTWGNTTKTIQSGDDSKVIAWQIYVNDTENNWNTTGIRTFSVDQDSPQWFDNSTNNRVPGQPTLFSVRWTENIDLDGYIFSFDNCTGTLVNETWTGTGFSGKEDWSNVTRTINITTGCTIRWRIYANDTNGYENVTDIFSFITADTIPPTYSNNQTQLVTTYTPTGYSNFSIEWNDNEGVTGVYLENNFSVTLENTTMTGSNPYTYNSSVLPAGTYQFRFDISGIFISITIVSYKSELVSSCW